MSVLLAQEIDQPVPEAMCVYFGLDLAFVEAVQQMDALQLMLLKYQRNGFLQKRYSFVEIEHIQHLIYCLSRFLPFFSHIPIWLPGRVLEYLIDELFEVASEGDGFGVSDSEVFSSEVEFELYF